MISRRRFAATKVCRPARLVLKPNLAQANFLPARPVRGTGAVARIARSGCGAGPVSRGGSRAGDRPYPDQEGMVGAIVAGIADAGPALTRPATAQASS